MRNPSIHPSENVDRKVPSLRRTSHSFRTLRRRGGWICKPPRRGATQQEARVRERDSFPCLFRSLGEGLRLFPRVFDKIQVLLDAEGLVIFGLIRRCS